METEMNECDGVNCNTPEKKQKVYITFGSLGYTFNQFFGLCTEEESYVQQQQDDREDDVIRNQNTTEFEFQLVPVEEISKEEASDHQGLLIHGDGEVQDQNIHDDQENNQPKDFESYNFVQQIDSTVEDIKEEEEEEDRDDQENHITDHFNPVIEEESTDQYVVIRIDSKDEEVTPDHNEEESLKDSVKSEQLLETTKEEGNEINAESALIVKEEQEEEPFVEVTRRKQKKKKNRSQDNSDELVSISDHTVLSVVKEVPEEEEEIEDETAKATKEKKRNLRNRKKKEMKKASRRAKESALATSYEMRNQVSADPQRFKKWKGKIMAKSTESENQPKKNNIPSSWSCRHSFIAFAALLLLLLVGGILTTIPVYI